MDALVTSAGGRAVLVVLLLAIASLAWWVRARRSGDVRAVRSTTPPATLDDLVGVVHTSGSALGDRATFVQISSEVCTPCRRTAAVLGRLAGETAGVQHVELDAVEHDALVRRLGILRTPTVLVLDHDGRERGRSSGAMTPVQAQAALALLTDELAPSGSSTVVRAVDDPRAVPPPTQHRA